MSTRSARLRLFAALIVFLAALALNLHTAWSALHPASKSGGFALPPVAEPDLGARRFDLPGTYRTGPAPTDRAIIVETGNRVRFAEVGTKHSPTVQESYHLARREKTLYLATAAGDLIELVDIDTLRFEGDFYRRAK